MSISSPSSYSGYFTKAVNSRPAGPPYPAAYQWQALDVDCSDGNAVSCAAKLAVNPDTVPFASNIASADLSADSIFNFRLIRPSVSLSCSPSVGSVRAGDSVTFTASASGSTGLIRDYNWRSVTASDNVNFTASTPTYIWSPATLPIGAHRFNLSAFDSSGERLAAANCSVNVTSTSNPSPTVSLSATPSVLSSPGISTLSWTVSNASSCTASGGWSGGKSVSGSAEQVNVSQSTRYILTCSNSSASVSGTAVVTIEGTPPPPPICTDPAASNFGGPLPCLPPPQTCPDGTTTFPCATPPTVPTINFFMASPSQINSGGGTNLSWSALNASSCSVSSDPFPYQASGLLTDYLVPVSGITSDTTFTLTCSSSSGGSASADASVDVIGWPPPPTLCPDSSSPLCVVVVPPPGSCADGDYRVTTEDFVTSAGAFDLCQVCSGGQWQPEGACQDVIPPGGRFIGEEPPLPPAISCTDGLTAAKNIILGASLPTSDLGSCYGTPEVIGPSGSLTIINGRFSPAVSGLYFLRSGSATTRPRQINVFTPEVQETAP